MEKFSPNVMARLGRDISFLRSKFFARNLSSVTREKEKEREKERERE
jgi:hypothetical protein